MTSSSSEKWISFAFVLTNLNSSVSFDLQTKWNQHQHQTKTDTYVSHHPHNLCRKKKKVHISIYLKIYDLHVYFQILPTMPPAPAPAKSLNWRHSIQQSPDHAALLHAGRQNKEENCTIRKRTNKVSLCIMYKTKLNFSNWHFITPPTPTGPYPITISVCLGACWNVG